MQIIGRIILICKKISIPASFLRIFMKESTVQIRFFKKIKDMLSPRISLVNEVSDLLGISNDSAYRRIRGETVLTMEELLALLKHYKLSLDGLDSADDNVSFTYKLIDNTDITFEKYLSAILEDMRRIERVAQKEIIYAAKDIPLFHHFRFPELAAFKIFFWMKSILNCPAYESEVFDILSLKSEEMDLGREILKAYTAIPATEIWTEETLNSTLRQVEYFWDSGFFKARKDALLVCDQLHEMLQHIKKQAELGYKYLLHPEASQEEGNFRLYLSDVMIGNNNILVKLGETQVTYLTHNTLNYLITIDQGFCKETDGWIKNLMRKSTLLSGASEKQRNQFFRKAQDNIRALQGRIGA